MCSSVDVFVCMYKCVYVRLCATHVCTHMYIGTYIHMCMQVCVCTHMCYTNQRTISSIFPHYICLAVLWERISHWPGTCQVGQTCSQRAPGIVSSPPYTTPVLGLQVYATTSSFFTFPFLFFSFVLSSVFFPSPPLAFLSYFVLIWIPGDPPLTLRAAQQKLHHLSYYPKCALL